MAGGLLPFRLRRPRRGLLWAAFLLLVGALASAGLARATAPLQDPPQVETRIEIKVKGEISPAQKAQVEALLKAFEGQEPRLKIETKGPPGPPPGPRGKERERESKAGKYRFFLITGLMLGLVATSALIMETRRRARFSFSLAGNIATILAFALVTLTGFLLIFGYKGERGGFDIKYWHVIAGLVLVYLILFHLVNNWRAWPSYWRRLLRLMRRAR